MAVNYAYKYAILEGDGCCMEVQDTTNYILHPNFVPIPQYDEWYLLKYYYPAPTTVTSFDDFQGSWYEDAEHTIPALRTSN